MKRREFIKLAIVAPVIPYVPVPPSSSNTLTEASLEAAVKEIAAMVKPREIVLGLQPYQREIWAILQRGPLVIYPWSRRGMVLVPSPRLDTRSHNPESPSPRLSGARHDSPTGNESS